MTKTEKSNSRFIPVALIALSAIPFLGGIVRLIGLIGGAAITPENARFVAVPLPVVLHIIAATTFSILGAFQFAPEFRRSRLGWHRLAGRVLVVCGLVTAVTGLWMAQFYPFTQFLQNTLLYALRLVFGSAMIVSLVLGTLAILRRDVVQHGAWMMRGYAIAQGAGTQALVTLLWMAFFGTPSAMNRSLLMGAGWVINLLVVEWVLRRSSRPRNLFATV